MEVSAIGARLPSVRIQLGASIGITPRSGHANDSQSADIEADKEPIKSQWPRRLDECHSRGFLPTLALEGFDDQPGAVSLSRALGGEFHRRRLDWAGFVHLKLEVVVLPVADVDRSKAFYQQLGFRLDSDFSTDRGLRVVQLTPPDSDTSIIVGTGITDATPGSTRGLHLVVSDITAAHADLWGRGIQVSEIWHDRDSAFHWAGGANRVSGPHPDADSYSSYVSFDDPDGNEWFVQQVVTRLPGH